MRLGISGISVVRLDIDIKGKVERCAIAKSSNESDLYAATCRVFSRARFNPAIGPNGNPMPASTIRRIVWKVPQDVKLDEG